MGAMAEPEVIPIHRAHHQQNQTSYLGIVIFVASWAMLFAALFMSYAILRLRSTTWPPDGFARPPLGLPVLATLALAASSAALQRGLSFVRRNEPERYLLHLVATLALGAAFLAFQFSVWWSLWQGGLTLQSGIFGGIFYLLTCFHALHVLVGLLLLAWLLPGARQPLDLGGKLGRLGVVAIYWHFVGVVWGVTFVAVYLI
jgi:heme/copper-type cytochrome/quinol oxidase subunit 3